jgi:hypothetical protein
MSAATEHYQQCLANRRAARENLLPTVERIGKAAAFLSDWRDFSESAPETQPRFGKARLGELLVQWPDGVALSKAYDAWLQANDATQRAYARLSEEEQRLVRPPDEIPA